LTKQVNSYSIKEIRNQLSNGIISKLSATKKIQEYCRHLFDISDVLSESIIREISIRENKILFTVEVFGKNVVLECAEQTGAGLPLSLLCRDVIPEPDVLSVMLKYLKAGDSFFDIGANIGWYGVVLPQFIDNLHVYSFEPSKKAYDILVKNMRNNHQSTQTAFEFGFSDENCTTKFYQNNDFLGASGLVNIEYSDNVELVVSGIMN